jgi:cysteinyl-tRNA synthetase
MSKLLINLLTVILEIVKIIFQKRFFPSPEQKKEEIKNELDKVNREIEKARSVGNDAAADSILRRLHKQESILSDGIGKNGECGDSNASSGNRDKTL